MREFLRKDRGKCGKIKTVHKPSVDGNKLTKNDNAQDKKHRNRLAGSYV